MRNGFLDRFTNMAPAAYPQVNQMTKPIRAACAAAAQEVPAAEVVRGILRAPTGP